MMLGLDRLWSRKSENAGLLEAMMLAVFGGAPSKSGQTVTPLKALECTTALACARVIAQGLAQMPLHLYRSRPDGRGTDVASAHPLDYLLHRRPNEWQTSFEFREQLGLHAALTNNAFAWISRRPDGTVQELLPLLPQWVTIKRRADWTIVYEVRAVLGTSGEMLRFTVERGDMLHIRGPSWDGVMGLEATRLVREAIGLALATEEHHAVLHANRAAIGGILSVEGNLAPDQQKKLKAYIEQEFAGTAQTGKTMIVDRAAKFTPMTMTGVDAQHLETRRFQIEEICRAFGVFPAMVGYSDKASTYASAEQFFLQHVVHTLGPWVERWQQAIERDLLSERDIRAGHYVKFAMQALLRGDAKSRSEFYARMIQWGIMTRNEARALEDLNWIEGLDEPLTPSNMLAGIEALMTGAPPPANPQT